MLLNPSPDPARRVRHCALRVPLLLLSLALGGRAAAQETAGREPIVVRSPDGTIAITLTTPSDAAPAYGVSYRGKEILPPAPLGMTFREGGRLAGLEVTDVRRDQRDVTYD